MAFEYRDEELRAAVVDFEPFDSDLPIARKLAELNERSIELTAHWSALPSEERDFQWLDYRTELVMIGKYNRLCIDNLVRNAGRQKTVEEAVEETADKMEIVPDLEASKKIELVVPELKMPYASFHKAFEKFCGMRPIQMGDVNQIKALGQNLVDFEKFMSDNDSKGFVPDVILVSVIHSKLDIASRASFALWFRGNENPSVSEVISYFQFIVESMEPMPEHFEMIEDVRLKPSTSSNVAPASKPVPLVRKIMRLLCAHCNVKHALHRCAQFKTATYSARCRTLNRHGLCYNCFSAGHTAVECPDNGCDRCKTKHNSIMCRQHWDGETNK